MVRKEAEWVERWVDVVERSWARMRVWGWRDGLYLVYASVCECVVLVYGLLKRKKGGEG